MKTIIISVLLLTGVSVSSFGKEDWGLAIGGISTPHYMGSAEQYELTIPFPFALTDGEMFFKKEGIYIDGYSHFKLPVSGERLGAAEPSNYLDEDHRVVQNKNYARRGMGYLPPALHLGIKLGWKMGPIGFEASSAPGVLLGNNWGNAGVMNRYGIRLYTFVDQSASSASCLCFSFDVIHTNDTYNKVYYSVDAQDALADRPAYDASKSGELGRELTITYLQRFDDLVLMALFNVQVMDNSVVKDSPLVNRERTGTVALAIAHMF